MKTAISIPDAIFNEAERYARNIGMTRSQLFTIAVKSYVKTNQHNQITEDLNKIYGQENSEIDLELSKMQSFSLEKEVW
jgi:metal-responsive CopG/Arc/MetJ family transcriptional regulator